MFGLFNRSNKIKLETEILLMKAVFNSLGEEFNYIKNQLNENIILGAKSNDASSPNYRKFTLNREILNKYEDKSGNYFSVNGIKVYDFELNDFVDIQIKIGFGLIQGYSTVSIKEFNPDVTRIDSKNHYIKIFGEDNSSIKKLFTKDELSFLSFNELYEVKLNGKSYFHIKDLEDGDFVGIDLNKNIYKITHDPFEIRNLEGSLIEILKSNDG